MNASRLSVASVCALAVVLLTGCSGTEPSVPATPTVPPVESTKEADDPVVSAEEVEPDPEETSTNVLADPSLMEKMSCEELAPSLLASMKLSYGTPTKSVQVEASEGLTPGEHWWVVAMDSPPDDAYQWGIRSFLTTAPGVEGEEGKWIEIDGPAPWTNVLWPDDKLVVAQTAFEKARACLEEAAPAN